MGVAEQLLNCLSDIGDVDMLHQFLLNDHTDNFGSPQFSAWLLELVNTERQRRSGNLVAVEFSIPEFSTWPASLLVQAVPLSLTMVEAAVMIGEASILAFAFKLCELLIGSLCVAHLDLVVSTHEQS